MISVLNVHENLVEVLLEMQAYSEVQVNGCFCTFLCNQNHLVKRVIGCL